MGKGIGAFVIVGLIALRIIIKVAARNGGDGYYEEEVDLSAPVPYEVQRDVDQMVRENPALKPGYDAALADGVLTGHEVVDLLDLEIE